MKVEGPADFFFDEVKGAACGAALLTGDGNAADALGGAFEQRVNMGLSCGADDHEMIGPVPGGHTHAANIVLKAAGGNFCGDHAVGLRVNVAKAAAAGERH